MVSLLDQVFPFGAIAGQEESNPGIVPQPLGSPEDGVEAVGHAVGADVGRDKLALHAELGGQRAAILLGRVEREIDAVGNHGDFARPAPGLDVGHEGIRHADDCVSLTVGKSLQPAEDPGDPAFPHGAHGHDGLGPEVPDLQHPGHPLQAAHQIACQPAEKLGRGGDHDINLRQRGGHQRGHEQIEKIVGAAAYETRIRRRQGQHPVDVDTRNFLMLKPPVAEARVDPAGGMIRHTGEHVHLVPLRRPLPAVLEGAAGRCVDLRRKVMGKKQDTHAGWPAQCRARGAPARS